MLRNLITVLITLSFSLSSFASTKSTIELQSQDRSKTSDVQYEMQIHHSAEEMNQHLKDQAQSEKKGRVYIHPKDPSALAAVKDGINRVSRAYETVLVYKDQLQKSAQFAGRAITKPLDSLKTSTKERLTQWVTVSIITGTAFVSWHFLGDASLTTSSILTAWTFITAIYYNVMVNTYFKTVDSSVKLLQRLSKTTSEKWTHRHRHLSLFLMSIGINFVTLSLINWNSLPAVLQTSPFYLYALKNATLGYLASDLWSAVFNRWKAEQRFSYEAIRYMNYAKNISLTLVMPLMMLEHFSGYIGTGVLIISGAVFSSRIGEKLITYNYGRFFRHFYSQAKSKIKKNRSMPALRCEGAVVF